MAWPAWLPRLTVPRKVSFANPKLNACFYLLHLPIIVYATIIFAVQKQYTEVISNNPFLMINLDPLNALPYFQGTNMTEPDLSIATWCAQAGGPYPCSAAGVREACLVLLNEDILMQVPTMTMTTLCTRMCDLTQLDASCMLPPSIMRQSGSTALQLFPYTAFNKGMFSGSNTNMLVSLHPLLRYAPLTFTYAFQMSRAAPFFFGSDPAIEERKTQADAYTVAADVNQKVLLVFPPGELVVVPPPDVVNLAGVVWNMTVLSLGAEFDAMVNCYTDSYDLPNLDWQGHSKVDALLERPVCLLTVELLRPSSSFMQTDAFGDVAQGATQLRVDTRRGNSYHRCPSFSAVVLNLISLAVLLKFPAMLTMLFATTCFGSLSRIYKRAQHETFEISSRIGQQVLRHVADQLALKQLETGAGVSKQGLQEEVLEILEKTAPGSQRNQASAEDLAAHVFRMLKHVKGYEGAEAESGQLAELMNLGQGVSLKEICGYFDPKRRRFWPEWFLLPASQRKLLRERKRAPALEVDEKAVEPSVAVEVDLQGLAEEVQELVNEVDRIKGKHVDDTEGRREKIERRLEQLFAAMDQLMEKVDAIPEQPCDDEKAQEGLAELKKNSDALESRLLKFEKENAKMLLEIRALHTWADARQEAAVEELEAAAVAATSATKEATKEVSRSAPVVEPDGARSVAAPAAAPAPEPTRRDDDPWQQART